VSVAPIVSENIPVVAKYILVVSIPSPELAFILKRVPSNSEISRSNTASPSEVVSDCIGCSIKVDCKGVKDRKTHKPTDKDVSAPSSGSVGVTVETVDKSVKFRLKGSKEKNKTDNLEVSDSESESVFTKRQSKRFFFYCTLREKYDGTTPLALILTNVEACAIYLLLDRQ